VRALGRRPGDPRGWVPSARLAAAWSTPATARGTGRTRSMHKRGEDTDRGPDPGRKLRLPWIRLPTLALPARRLVAAIHTEVEGADSSVEEAQGDLSPLHLSTCGPGDPVDQPDRAGLGELLQDRAREPVLRLRERLGREEGAAAHDARQEPARVRLEEGE